MLDGAEDGQQVVAGDVFDRALDQGGQDVLFEDPEDLRQRALTTFVQAQAAEVDPLVVDRLEGMFCFILSLKALLLTVFTGGLYSEQAVCALHHAIHVLVSD